MIIDRILDRIYNATEETPYNAHDFYFEVIIYGRPWGDRITEEMDYGTEESVRHILCEYIDTNEYNPLIKDYINAVTWLETTPIEADKTEAFKFLDSVRSR